MPQICQQGGIKNEGNIMANETAKHANNMKTISSISLYEKGRYHLRISAGKKTPKMFFCLAKGLCRWFAFTIFFVGLW